MTVGNDFCPIPEPNMGDGIGDVSDSLNSFMGVASRENCGGGVTDPDPPEREGSFGLILRM